MNPLSAPASRYHHDVPARRGAISYGADAPGLSLVRQRSVGDIREPRSVTAQKLAIIMGTSRIDADAPLLETPFDVRIPGSSMGVETSLMNALKPDKAGVSRLTNVDFQVDEQVIMTGELVPFPVFNGLSRFIGLHAESQPDPNAPFDPDRIRQHFSLDNGVVRTIVHEELLRIAYQLARRQVVNNQEQTVLNPHEKGMGLLHRALNDAAFSDGVFGTTQTIMDNIDDGGFSFTWRGLVNNPRVIVEGEHIWRNSLSADKIAIPGTNVLQYEVSDGACWAQLISSDDGVAVVVHAGESRVQKGAPLNIQNVPHGWVREGITAENPNVLVNFDRAFVRSRILVSPATAGCKYFGGALSTRANTYNFPPQREGTKTPMYMFPGFPQETCSDDIDRLQSENPRAASELFGPLCTLVVEPYILARKELNKRNFTAELPKGSLAPNDIDKLRAWANAPTGSLPLQLDRAQEIYVHIISRVREVAGPIFDELMKLA